MKRTMRMKLQSKSLRHGHGVNRKVRSSKRMFANTQQIKNESGAETVDYSRSE